MFDVFQFCKAMVEESRVVVVKTMLDEKVGEGRGVGGGGRYLNNANAKKEDCEEFSHGGPCV